MKGFSSRPGAAGKNANHSSECLSFCAAEQMMDKSSGALQLVLGKCFWQTSNAQRHSIATVCQTESLGNLIFHPFKSLNCNCCVPRQMKEQSASSAVCASRGVPLWVYQGASSNSPHHHWGQQSFPHQMQEMHHLLIIFQGEICWSFTSEPWRGVKGLKCRSWASGQTIKTKSPQWKFRVCIF